MKQFKERKPTRLRNYDYADSGWYFITICTKDKENIFGECENIVGADGSRPSYNLQLNEFGLIVDEELKISEKIRNEIQLDEYIIMPNHIHMIVIINKFNHCKNNHSSEGRLPSTPVVDPKDRTA